MRGSRKVRLVRSRVLLATLLLTACSTPVGDSGAPATLSVSGGDGSIIPTTSVSPDPTTSSVSGGNDSIVPTTSASPSPTTSTSNAVGPADALFYGVFVGLQLSGDPNSYIAGTSNSYVTFYENGTVLKGLPAEGAAAYSPGTGQVPLAGRYQASGGSVEIQWDTGDVAQAAIADGQFELYGNDYGVVDPLDGLSLDGTYTRASGGSGRKITFGADGRFADEGIVTDTGLLVTVTTSPTGPGSYGVHKNTLQLDYDDGTAQSVSIYALPQDVAAESPLVLAGFVFRLVG